MATNIIMLKNADQHAHQKIVEVLNVEFGRHVPVPYRLGDYSLDEHTVVWFPTLTGADSDCGGWQNALSEDGNIIITKYVGSDPQGESDLQNRNLNAVHIVFARNSIPGPRKFIGVFDSQFVNGLRVYRRIATELTIDTTNGEVTWPGKEVAKNDDHIMTRVSVRITEKLNGEKIILGCAPYFVILVLGIIALWGLFGMPGIRVTNVSTCAEEHSCIVTNEIGEVVKIIQGAKSCATNKWE